MRPPSTNWSLSHINTWKAAGVFIDPCLWSRGDTQRADWHFCCSISPAPSLTRSTCFRVNGWEITENDSLSVSLTLIWWKMKNSAAFWRSDELTSWLEDESEDNVGHEWRGEERSNCRQEVAFRIGVSYRRRRRLTWSTDDKDEEREQPGTHTFVLGHVPLKHSRSTSVSTDHWVFKASGNHLVNMWKHTADQLKSDWSQVCFLIDQLIISIKSISFTYLKVF